MVTASSASASRRLVAAIRVGRDVRPAGSANRPIGARTGEGLTPSRRAHWIHGRYSQGTREAPCQARLEDPYWIERECQAMVRRTDREQRRRCRAMNAQWRAALKSLGLR